MDPGEHRKYDIECAEDKEKQKEIELMEKAKNTLFQAIKVLFLRKILRERLSVGVTLHLPKINSHFFKRIGFFKLLFLVTLILYFFRIKTTNK